MRGAVCVEVELVEIIIDSTHTGLYSDSYQSIKVVVENDAWSCNQLYRQDMCKAQA